MNKMKRFLAQSLIWLIFGVLLWNYTDQDQLPTIDILIKFFFQLGIITIVIYLAADQLFKKRRIVFFIFITVIVIIGFSALMPLLVSEHQRFGPPPTIEQYERHMPPPRPPGPNLFWNIILLFGITYTLAIFWESAVFAIKKEEETIRNKAEHVQTELKLLKSQINPHFLFNSLNNIYALSVMNSSKTQQSISNLSNMLRYVLYECEQPLVPIQKEIEYIQNYIELFSLKSSNPYSIITQFNINSSQNLVAPMLFIPFIENALKHGNIEQRDKSFIHISIKNNKDRVFYTVENTISNSSKSKDDLGGIGLENVRKRLRILYPDTHELDISQSENVFKIKLTLQLNFHD